MATLYDTASQNPSPRKEDSPFARSLRRTGGIEFPPPSLAWALSPEQWQALRGLLDADLDLTLEDLFGEAVAEYLAALKADPEELAAASVEDDPEAPFSPTSRHKLAPDRLGSPKSLPVARVAPHGFPVLELDQKTLQRHQALEAGREGRARRTEERQAAKLKPLGVLSHFRG